MLLGATATAPAPPFFIFAPWSPPAWMKPPNAAHNFPMDGTAMLVGLNQQSAFAAAAKAKGAVLCDGDFSQGLPPGPARRWWASWVPRALTFPPAGSFYYQTVGMGGPLGSMSSVATAVPYATSLWHSTAATQS
jgi:hypothetical protein